MPDNFDDIFDDGGDFADDEGGENVNSLEGFKCPKCGQKDEFQIAVQCWATVRDDGVEDYGDTEWDDDSACQCPDCGFAGKVKDFTKPEDKPCPEKPETRKGMKP